MSEREVCKVLQVPRSTLQRITKKFKLEECKLGGPESGTW